MQCFLSLFKWERCGISSLEQGNITAKHTSSHVYSSCERPHPPPLTSALGDSLADQSNICTDKLNKSSENVELLFQALVCRYFLPLSKVYRIVLNPRVFNFANFTNFATVCKNISTKFLTCGVQCVHAANSRKISKITIYKNLDPQKFTTIM